jgi:hypothetical protein
MKSGSAAAADVVHLALEQLVLAQPVARTLVEENR